MSIVIYTYSNPYKISYEKYWSFIKNSFHICASQTLVNGLCQQYNSDFFQGKLTTVDQFINHLYDGWESDSSEIKQRAIIDNLIETMTFQCVAKENIDIEDIRSSLKRNRSYVLQSIRIMFELEMKLEHIQESALTYEQKCIVEIYKEILHSNNRMFKLRNDQTKDEIDGAILNTMLDTLKNGINKEKINDVNIDLIVVHGVHQFTPIMLRMIELLSKYKNVVLLFNYVPDYKNVYQTWLNVYSWFESKINISDQNFYKDSQEFPGGRISNNMAALIAGSTASINFSDKVEVTRFDNQTEFAGYIAKKFEKAQQERMDDGFKHPTLYYMDEQIYAANSSVNEILKIYFPEQFGERNFLDYPIGHFFISVANMWNEDEKRMIIQDMMDVYDCLACGIIEEKKPGELAATFDKCNLFIQKETTLTGIIKKLKRLKKRVLDFEDDQEAENFARVVYFEQSEEEIDHLIKGLQDLKEITKAFYDDFSEQSKEFKSFYNKVSEVLITHVINKEEIDPEFREIVQRLLIRLEEVKDIEAEASFDCLKESMQIYLQQLPESGRGANWIVRNFAQIDGDVLRSTPKNRNLTYHFACLSDQDMSITHKDEFPWPLDIEFFEVAQAPVDWKYQVYVTSRLEYKNFRRYALVSGLAFSKAKIKLSYIKNENNDECDMYYLFKVLNAKEILYEQVQKVESHKSIDQINLENTKYKKFDTTDLIKFRLCKYRFLLESVIENNSVYKDEFLIKQYVAIMLEHHVRQTFENKNYIKNTVHNFLENEIEELAIDFPFLQKSDMMDIVSTAKKYIENNLIKKGKFLAVGNNEKNYMKQRENFLMVPSAKCSSNDLIYAFKDSTDEEVNLTLCKDTLENEIFQQSYNSICSKCANKDICLELFKFKGNSREEN